MTKKSTADRVMDRVIEDAVTNEQEIVRLKHRLKVLDRKYRESLRQIYEMTERESLLESLTQKPAKHKLQKANELEGDATAVLVLTDWHVEQTIAPEQVNGLNEFNLEIAERRIKTVFEKFIWLLDVHKKFADINEIVVAVLGDMIAGYIHPELEESNQLSPAQACLFFQEHFLNGLDFLLKKTGVSRIIVACCYGNHGRTTQEKRMSTSHMNSFEWLTYRSMAARPEYSTNPRLVWRIADGYHNILDIQGLRVRFHHGDAIRYGGGIGGISVPANRMIKEWNMSERADLDMFGHFHQHLDHWRWLCCGSLCGYDSYAHIKGMTFQPPTQTVTIISKKKQGRILTAPILLD